MTEYGNAELSVDDVIDFETEIARSDILLLQQEVPKEVNEKAIEAAKKYNVKVILNPAPIRSIDEKIIENIDIITPNEHEKSALNINKFKMCVTTLGSRGCSINDKEFIPAIKVNAVNTTGAGDVFNGALAACIAKGMTVAEACRIAVAASGISVEGNFVIDSIPKADEVYKRIGKGVL